MSISVKMDKCGKTATIHIYTTCHHIARDDQIQVRDTLEYATGKYFKKAWTIFWITNCENPMDCSICYQRNISVG